jgi:hypothetical protein
MAVEEQAVLLDPRSPEVVADAAHGDHQRVVVDDAARDDLPALPVQDRGEGDPLGGPVEAVHAALLEAEAVRLGVAEVEDVVLVRVERPGRDLVEQRLPDVGQVRVDKRDAGLPAPRQLAAEPGRQDETARRRPRR